MDWSKHAAVLTITMLLFLSGILIGTFISTGKVDQVKILTDELRTSTMSSEVEFAILTQNPCQVTDLGYLNDELQELSLKVEFLENQLGHDNKDVIELKNFYSIIQLRHWLLIDSIISQCDDVNLSTIVYFYSNEKDCDDCSQQGFILNHLRRVEEVNIYSIDINLENNAVLSFKKVNNVTTAPTLIIDGVKYEGFRTLRELRTIVNE